MDLGRTKVRPYDCRSLGARAPMRRKTGREVVLDLVVAAERGWHANVAGKDGSDCEHDERQRHRRRRVMKMSVSFTGSVIASCRGGRVVLVARRNRCGPALACAPDACAMPCAVRVSRAMIVSRCAGSKVRIVPSRNTLSGMML